MDGVGIHEVRLRTAINSFEIGTLVAECEARHDRLMGSGRTRSLTPDLFSTASATVPLPPRVNSSPPVVTDAVTAATPSPYALPTNLPSALRHLDGDQLDRLLAAVVAEQQRRGSKNLPKPDKPRRHKQAKKDAPPLAQGKLNAVRAAFKAGVKPSRIAREFGISQSDVRKALASEGKKA